MTESPLDRYRRELQALLDKQAAALAKSEEARRKADELLADVAQLQARFVELQKEIDAHRDSRPDGESR